MTPTGASHLDTLDDRLLLRRHSEGDEDAFGVVLGRHRDRLWAVAVDVCGDRDAAADAVHDGILSAFREAGSHPADTAVGTWLLRAVVRACRDVIRMERSAVGRPTATTGPQPVDPRTALHQLPAEQRLALVLGDVHGVPTPETAEVLGVPVETVTRWSAQGREDLAAVLAEGRSGTTGTPEPSTTSDTTDHHGTNGGGHDR